MEAEMPRRIRERKRDGRAARAIWNLIERFQSWREKIKSKNRRFQIPPCVEERQTKNAGPEMKSKCRRKPIGKPKSQYWTGGFTWRDMAVYSV